MPGPLIRNFAASTFGRAPLAPVTRAERSTGCPTPGRALDDSMATATRAPAEAEAGGDVRAFVTFTRGGMGSATAAAADGEGGCAPGSSTRGCAESAAAAAAGPPELRSAGADPNRYATAATT